MMADGHLGKCKSCAKFDVAIRNVTRRDYIAAYEKRRSRTKARKDCILHHARRWRKKYPEKVRAHNMVTRAIRNGILKKQRCQFSGCKKLKVEAHHPDYSKPLYVIWYCHAHHRVVEGRVSQFSLT
jgi:hypothetical protein